MNENNIKDHDLLIRIDEKLEGVIKEIQNLKDGVNLRIATLENIKIDREQAVELHRASIEKQVGFEGKQTDFESRVRRLERWGWTAIGGLFILQLAFTFFMTYGGR